MEQKNADIVGRIVELRIAAGQKLKGNDYFGVAHQLDSLLADSGLTETEALARLERIRALIHPGEAAVSDNMSQALAGTVSALRAEAGEKLRGNAYFEVAHKLDAVLAGGVLESPAAESLLRQVREALDINAPAGDDAEGGTGQDDVVIASPAANSFGTPQPTVAVRFAVEEELSADAPESDTGSEDKTGFDMLNEASWRRVQEVSRDDPARSPMMNGSAAGESDAAAPAVGEEEGVAFQAGTAPAPVSGETVMTAAAEPVQEQLDEHQETVSFRVMPRPLIINRPVKKAFSVRPKRAAKLPHLPRRRS